MLGIIKNEYNTITVVGFFREDASLIKRLVFDGMIKLEELSHYVCELFRPFSAIINTNDGEVVRVVDSCCFNLGNMYVDVDVYDCIPSNSVIYNTVSEFENAVLSALSEVVEHRK